MSAALVACGGAFAAGLGSSIGPCAAPRYLIASAALSAGARSWALAAFAAGSTGGYAAYAVLGAGLLRIGASSHAVYIAIAGALAVAGIATLFARFRPCAHGRRVANSPGALFLLGASSALVLSPCCTPVALAIGMQAGFSGAGPAAAALASFGAGHALPLIVAAGGAASMRGLAPPEHFRDPSAVVGGTLLLAVSALYAVLA